MARDRGPTKRLLVVPALLLAVIVVAVVQVRASAPAAPPTGVQVPVSGMVTTPGLPAICVRDTEPELVAAIRAAQVRGGRVSSTQVLGCPAAFDGLRVRYAGEVVGDVLHRPGGAWVLVNDDAYALEVGPLPAHGRFSGVNQGLAVWVPEPLVTELTDPGRPGRRGQVIEVAGRVVRSDPQDAGRLTLRADRLDVLADAVDVAVPVPRGQLLLAGASVVVALTLAGLRFRDRSRHRRSW